MSASPFERFYNDSVMEKFIPVSGIQRWITIGGVKITGVSTSNWQEYIHYLNLLTEEDKLVVSPELITVAGEDEILGMRATVEKRIDQILDISRRYPASRYVLGTALFGNIGDRPGNSAMVINNGNVLGYTQKRTWSNDWEKIRFSFEPEEKPLTIPGTKIGVLICSDFPLATMYDINKKYNLDLVLKLTGKTNLLGKTVRFINDDVETLVVLSCWGVSPGWMSGNPNNYFKFQMRCFALQLIGHQNLQEIIVVDRLPIGESGPTVPTEPFNARFRIKTGK